MKQEGKYRELCASRGLSEKAIDAAVAAVEALEAEAEEPSGPIRLPAVEKHVAGLVERGEAAESRIMALARYCGIILGENAIAIRLLAYLGPIGVLSSMAGRLCALEGGETRDRVMKSVAEPPPGSPPETYPIATAAFVSALERELGKERARRVLTWNVHGVPPEAFAAEREAYLAASSLEEWLSGWHERMVAVLEKHAASGMLWYEQHITPRVVDFVRANQELLGAVREGDRLYATKIPYDPDRYLTSKDPLEKRRLACHCPLAASTITAEGSGVPAAWCACSAGYEKFIFDVVFGEETEAFVLESVLAGDDRCRFAVRIPESVLKRFKA